MLPDYEDDVFGHISFMRFGITDELFQYEPILNIARKFPNLNGYEKEIYLREEYLSRFHILDLDSLLADNPLLPTISYNKKEWYSGNDMTAKRREQYMLYSVWDNYHISLDEFVNRPRHEIEEILEEMKVKLEEKMKMKELKETEGEKK